MQDILWTYKHVISRMNEFPLLSANHATFFTTQSFSKKSIGERMVWSPSYQPLHQRELSRYKELLHISHIIFITQMSNRRKMWIIKSIHKVIAQHRNRTRVNALKRYRKLKLRLKRHKIGNITASRCRISMKYSFTVIG